MARVTETFNFGDFVKDGKISPEDLLLLLERLYTDLAVALNTKPDLVQRNTDGQTNETFLSQGTLNINLSTNKVEMLTNHSSPSAVVWTTLS